MTSGWREQKVVEFLLIQSVPNLIGKGKVSLISNQMCTGSLLAVEGCMWFSYREEQKKGHLSNQGQGTWFFYHSMWSPGAYIYISVLGTVLILHKLKLNGHQHEVSAVVSICGAFFRLVFSFGISWNSRSWESLSPKSVSPVNLFCLIYTHYYGLSTLQSWKWKASSKCGVW